jgi:outer membrane protein TolC
MIRFAMHAGHAAATFSLVIAIAAGAGAQQPVAPAGDSAGPLTLTLAEAVRLAEDKSHEVRIARAGVTRARGLELQAASQLLPQLFGSAAYTKTLRSQFSALSSPDTATSTSPPGPCEQYLRDASASTAERLAGLENAQRCALGQNPFGGFGNLGFGAANQYQLGLSLSQNVFTGGRIRSQIAAARAGRRAAEVTLASERAQAALTVAQAYFDAALSERLAAIAELSLRQSDAVVSQVQLARDVGRTSEFELLRARVARDNQRPVLVQRQSEREISLLRLRQLLDLRLDAPVQLATPVDDTGAVYVAIAPMRTAEVTDPDSRAPVRAARAGVDAGQASLRAVRAQRLPAVTLTSNYGRVAFPASGFPGNNDFRENWTIGLAAQVPLFIGGRKRGEEMAARGSLEESRARLEQIRELAALDIRVQETALAQARGAWEASAGTAELAQRAFAIAQVRYREGISTQLELDDSRLLLEQAEVNRATAARNLQLAIVRVALLQELPLQLQSAGIQLPAQQQQAPPEPPRGNTQQAQGQQASQQQIPGNQIP